MHLRLPQYMKVGGAYPVTFDGEGEEGEGAYVAFALLPVRQAQRAVWLLSFVGCGYPRCLLVGCYL